MKTFCAWLHSWAIALRIILFERETYRILRDYKEFDESDFVAFEPADCLAADAAWPYRTSDTSKVTRFEVITSTGGREYVQYDVSVKLSLQDDGRTLKVFLKES